MARPKVSQPEKRVYQSKLRAAQADATRQAILAAAGRVCRRVGWAGATIAAIAQEADVAKDTVHAVFGGKAALIGEMVKANVAEATPGRHFLDEERPLAIRAENDRARQIELWSTYLAEILDRVSPLMAVVRTGAEAEPEIAQLYKTLHQGRRSNLRMIAVSIVGNGKSSTAMPVQEAADILWQLASPEMFTLLTTVGGYSAARYAKWLSSMLKAAFLRGHVE